VWNRQLSPIRGTVLRLSDSFPTDLPIGNTLHASSVIAIGRPAYPSASPHRDIDLRGGPECYPVVHQLRLSASPLVPPDPERINLSHETLDFRRGGFSPPLSLLMPAGSLLNSPPVVSVWLQTVGNALLPRIEINQCIRCFGNKLKPR